MLTWTKVDRTVGKIHLANTGAHIHTFMQRCLINFDAHTYVHRDRHSELYFRQLSFPGQTMPLPLFPSSPPVRSPCQLSTLDGKLYFPRSHRGGQPARWESQEAGALRPGWGEIGNRCLWVVYPQRGHQRRRLLHMRKGGEAAALASAKVWRVERVQLPGQESRRLSAVSGVRSGDSSSKYLLVLTL